MLYPQSLFEGHKIREDLAEEAIIINQPQLAKEVLVPSPPDGM